jgi:hypothetical protein
MGKLIRIPLALIPRSRVVPIVSGPLKGSRWISGSSVHACWIGTYELKKLKLVCKLLKSGQTMYDLGANAGLYSLLGSRIVGPSRRIFAFEPLSENCRNFEWPMELNHITNCHLFNVAVSGVEVIQKFEIENGLLMGRLSDPWSCNSRAGALSSRCDLFGFLGLYSRVN